MKVGTDGILLGAWCCECRGETGSRLILPTPAGQEFIVLARNAGLICRRCCEVRPTPDKSPSRLLLEFSRTAGGTLVPESVTVETATRHDYSAAFRVLTREFYLRY